MEHQDQEVYTLRKHKQSRYDKRLILKIVKEVENGLPRKEALLIYELGKTLLDSWMRDFDSTYYNEKIRVYPFHPLHSRPIAKQP